ncbi:MAG: tRNA (adenosine(37)-N6)-threonylcarbamoyltransferase complex ATPase subunit type 1 TsaE [Acidimicrobiia bacterium]
MKIVSKNPEQTATIARALAELLQAGDVVALLGDLGAGKTTFVRSCAQALGVTEPVTSPTFTIVHEYTANPMVVHIDAYRLDSAGEFVGVGSDELLGIDTIAFVEWANHVSDALPVDRLELTLTWADGPDSREVEITARGNWVQRRPALLAALRAVAPVDEG